MATGSREREEKIRNDIALDEARHAAQRMRRDAVVAALRRITGFFRTLLRNAEQLSAEDRWRRILAEALKKYLGGHRSGRQPWLPPPRAAPTG